MAKAKRLDLIPPGEILLEEFMIPLGISQNKLSRDRARPSHHGQARHRIGRSPIRQEKAAERSLGYGQGLRRRGRPARCDPKGGGYRTTGCVKTLARCTDIAPRAFPNLSSDIHRAAPVHGKTAGLVGKISV